MFLSKFPTLLRRSIVLVIAAFSFGIPASAMATTQQLPDGQSLVFVPCQASESTLYTLDLGSGAVTAIGSKPIASGVCYASTQFDPLSRTLVTYDSASNDWRPKSLIRLDPKTGETLGVINLVIDEWDDSPDAGVVPLSGVNYYMIDSMTIDTYGNMYLFLEDHKMYYAEATGVANTYKLKFLIDTPRYALASGAKPTQPGSIYALFEDNDYDVENNRFYKFTITYAGRKPQSAIMSPPISSDCRYSCFGMAFDSNGVAWLQNYRVDVGQNLSNGMYTSGFESASPTFTRQTVLPWDYYSLTVIPTGVLTASENQGTDDSNTDLANTGTNALLLMQMSLLAVVVGIVVTLAGRLRASKMK